MLGLISLCLTACIGGPTPKEIRLAEIQYDLGVNDMSVGRIKVYRAMELVDESGPAAIEILIAEFGGDANLPEVLYGIAGRYEGAEQYELSKVVHQRIAELYPGGVYAGKAGLQIRKEEIIQVLNAGGDDDEVLGGDPDLAWITLYKPSGAVDSDINGNITVTFPGNINAFKDPNKAQGAAAASYSLSDLPVDIYLEGKTASSSILDSAVKVEMTLDSNIKCHDEIRYTVIQIKKRCHLDTVPALLSSLLGGFMYQPSIAEN